MGVRKWYTVTVITLDCKTEYIYKFFTNYSALQCYWNCIKPNNLTEPRSVYLKECTTDDLYLSNGTVIREWHS